MSQAWGWDKAQQRWDAPSVKSWPLGFLVGGTGRMQALARLRVGFSTLLLKQRIGTATQGLFKHQLLSREVEKASGPTL